MSRQMNENMVTRVIKQTNQCMEDLISTFTQKMKIMEDKMDNIINENTYLRGKVNVVINASIEQNQSLHEKIDSLMGMNKVLVEEIESLKKPKVKKPKPDLVERVRCKCLTKKGEQCRKFCIEGHDTCKQHAKIQTESTTKNDSLSDDTDKSPPDKPDGRKRKVPVKRKVAPPVHNHKPGETPDEPCELCNSHGDVFDTEMPDEEFSGVSVDGITLEERLRRAIEEEEVENGSGSECIEENSNVNSDTTNLTSWADIAEEDNNVKY